MTASLNLLAFTVQPAQRRTYTQSTQKRKVDITETSPLAYIVRRKLAIEAARPDYHLRIVVGHANFLDYLIHNSAKVEQKEKRRLKKQTTAGAFTALEASRSNLGEASADYR
ncbi:MAG: hypothetical protein M1823_007188, partial [Watsoniomyces obsoletus]